MWRQLSGGIGLANANNSGFFKSDARVRTSLRACMMMMPIFMFGLGSLPRSYSVRSKDGGLPNLNLPIAANPELGPILLGKPPHFSHRIEIDDSRLATKARQCFPICHFTLHFDS
jgi:hypothetical protein